MKRLHPFFLFIPCLAAPDDLFHVAIHAHHEDGAYSTQFVVEKTIGEELSTDDIFSETGAGRWPWCAIATATLTATEAGEFTIGVERTSSGFQLADCTTVLRIEGRDLGGGRARLGRERVVGSAKLQPGEYGVEIHIGCAKTIAATFALLAGSPFLLRGGSASPTYALG